MTRLRERICRSFRPAFAVAGIAVDAIHDLLRMGVGLLASQTALTPVPVPQRSRHTLPGA